MTYAGAREQHQQPNVHARITLGKAASCHNQKQAVSRSRWRRQSCILVTTVLVCLLLRYVVDIKISVSWRTTPWHAKAVQGVRHCSNTCFKARNGVCNEGRPGTNSSAQQQQQQQQQQQGQSLLPDGVSAVECDLGTDCADCGPWFGPQAHLGWSEPELPIAYLRSQNISVRSRLVNPQTAAPLTGMSFAYVDPALDVDVSRHMELYGVVEIGISQVFYNVLHQRCGVLRGGSHGLVVDVGANFGYFSVLAAKLGCSVMAWEPVPHFRALLSYNIAANKLTHLVTVRDTVVADNPGGTQVVHVPNRGIWGTAGIDGANIDTGIENDGDYLKVEVAVDSLDDVLAGQHIDLMKVDVEGYEPAVTTTATQLLADGAVDNIILEYTPGVLERAAKWGEMWRPPQMLTNLTAAGFDLMWLPDDFTRSWSESRSIAQQLPTLRTITPQNLAYDLWDAHAFRTGWLGDDETPFCQALVELDVSKLGIPERLHPKSFHANFAHNTNVWATRNKQLLQQQPEIKGKPVGIIPLDVPTHTSWFPPPGVSTGLGNVDCNALAAEMKDRIDQQLVGKDELKAMMAVLIGRRCRCTHQLPCQQVEEAAERCTRAGQTPYQD